MTTNALYNKLCSLVNDNIEETPEKGFKTTREWCNEFGKTEFVVNKLIKNLKKLGKVETKQFRRKWAGGIRPVTHYKFITNGN